MFYTYTYFIDDTPRYVGKGSKGRFYDHMTPHAKNAWATYLRRAIEGSRKVVIDFQVHASDAEAKAFEISLVAKYGRIDLGLGTLFNLTNGGDGVSSGKPLSPEHKAAMSATTKGRPKSEEWKAKVSATLTGRKRSPEDCAKMSAGKTGKPWSAARRAAYEARKACRASAS